MANLQVKNVPEPLHAKIRRHAKREGRTVREFVLEAVRRAIAREEFQQRLRSRERVDLGRLAATSVGEVRAERDKERSA
jgi:plasmid stability protein